MSKILNTSIYPAGENAPPPQKTRKKLGKIRFKQKHLAFPYGVMVAIFVIIPLIVLLIAAFRGSKGDGGFTLTNFSNFFSNGAATTDLWNRIGVTFLLALLTTAVCLAISYPLALALCSLKVDKRAVLIMLFVAPMWINSLLRIYAVKLVFAGVTIDSFLLVLIGMVYDFLPFMLLPVYTSLAGMDKSYVEAASDLGASPLRTLIKVKLPLSVPGIVSGVIMVFMPAMSTFAISAVLANKFNLFGNMIEEWMRGGLDGIGSAYSLVLLVIMGITFFVSNRFTKIQSRGEGVL